MSHRRAWLVALLVAAGCSSQHAPDLGDGGVPMAPGPTPRIAGATMLSTGTSDLVDAMWLRMVVDASGDPLLVWQVGTGEIWQSRLVSGSWTAGAVIDKTASLAQFFDVWLDGDGNATVSSAIRASQTSIPRQIWRAPAGGAWAPVAAANDGLIASGPHGALAHLWTQFVRNPDTTETATVLASQFAPASGWSAASTLATFSSAANGDATATPLAVGILADGTSLATWQQQITPASGGPPSVQLSFALRPPGAAWGAPMPVSFPNVSDANDFMTLFTDGAGDAMWLTPETLISGSTTQVQLQSLAFAGAAWSPMQMFPLDAATGTNWSAAMGAGGTTALALTGQKSVFVEYATPQSAWQRSDPDAQDARFAAVGRPRVAVDGQGNVIVAWIKVTGFVAPHLYYARFSPASGWTTPVMVDGDDNPGMPGDYAVATNAAGSAFIVWEKSAALWVAPLP